jgi:S1-C subfamily serine protease
MPRGPLGGGAGFGRCLRSTCATALALVAAGIVASSDLAPGLRPIGPALADVRQRPSPLAFHATVLAGPITGSGFLIADGLAVTNAHVLGERRAGASVRLIASIGSAEPTAA